MPTDIVNFPKEEVNKKEAVRPTKGYQNHAETKQLDPRQEGAGIDRAGGKHQAAILDEKRIQWESPSCSR